MDYGSLNLPLAATMLRIPVIFNLAHRFDHTTTSTGLVSREAVRLVEQEVEESQEEQHRMRKGWALLVLNVVVALLLDASPTLAGNFVSDLAPRGTECGTRVCETCWVHSSLPDCVWRFKGSFETL